MKLEDKKTIIFKKKQWGNWGYIVQLPQREEEKSNSLTKLALILSKDKLLIEKFGGTNVGKLEVVTDYSLNYNKVGFNGKVYYQESGVNNSELHKFYCRLGNLLFNTQQDKKELDNLIHFARI